MKFSIGLGVNSKLAPNIATIFGRITQNQLFGFLDLADIIKFEYFSFISPYKKSGIPYLTPYTVQFLNYFLAYNLR